MKIRVEKNIDKDISNWQRSLSAKSYGVNWGRFLPEDISSAEVQDNNKLKEYLEKRFYSNGKVDKFVTWIKQHINASEIQEDLEGLMGKPFLQDKVTIIVTTFSRAPYSVEGSLFYIIFRDAVKKERTISGIYHELMHFLFHKHYWQQCEKADLSETEIHNLKESMTVLLNPILAKRGLPLDKGYDAHQKIRGELEKMWEDDEEKNFEKFLTKVLENHRSVKIQK